MKLHHMVVFGLILAIFALTGATQTSLRLHNNATILRPRSSQVGLADNWGKMPLYFIANQGQIENPVGMDERVAFYVQGSDKTLYFTPDGVTFALNDPTTVPSSSEEKDAERGRWNVKLDFVDANSVQPIGQEQTDAVISYFKGPQDEWHTGLPTFSKIVYRDLWQGIDLVYGGTINRLKYEFVVQPGVDPAHIRLAYRGATVRVNDAGQLEVSTPLGGFNDDTPVAYQEVNGQHVSVAVSYALDDGVVYGFRLGEYDATLPLVIDPAVLVYCGYIGGSGADSGEGIAVDGSGNVYVTGYTESSEATFPVTVGPDLTYNGSFNDAFVAKVKADGSGLVYAGYIGGSGVDQGYDIAVDSAGNAYVTGYTESTEATFPKTVGPDLTYNGGEDAFVAKVNAAGTGLVYAGYIGGSGDERGRGIAVDTQGNAYVTGDTVSGQTSFPVTVGPDLTYNAGGDAFVAKVKANGTGLDYCGYIGGSGDDWGEGIAVDAAGNAYVTGYTGSPQATFPLIVGPDLTYNGGGDAFVAKLRTDGTALVYCGYIGGSGTDYGRSIAVDTAGNAYVTGETSSTQGSFPVTIGPDLTHNGGGGSYPPFDAYVAKVNVDGTGLVYCGYIGGNAWDFGTNIAVDTMGNAYVTGYTYADEATFPVTVGPDLTYNGNGDAFVAKVKTDGTGLVYCGYIGGNDIDLGIAIAVDSAGNVYVTGHTYSTQAAFPVTIGPDLTFNGGPYDAFVAKISYTSGVNLYLPLILR